VGEKNRAHVFFSVSTYMARKSGRRAGFFLPSTYVTFGLLLKEKKNIVLVRAKG